MAYERTLKISQEILKKGFNLVECWEHQIIGRLPVELPKKKTETFPHAMISISKRCWTDQSVGNQQRNCCLKTSIFQYRFH